MSKTLYATWLDGDRDQIAEYMDVLRKVPGVEKTAVYQPAPRSERMQAAQRELVDRLDAPEMGTAKAWMLAEVEAPVVGLTITEKVGPRPEQRATDGPARIVVNQQLLHETNDVRGVEKGDGDFAPAVQFGILSTRSVDTEWKILDWYERLRLQVVATVPGMIRTRRYVSIAGIAKFAVLYEFLSVEARLTGFEEHHERRGTDPHNPWQLREFALHCPGAPFVGARLDV